MSASAHSRKTAIAIIAIALLFFVGGGLIFGGKFFEPPKYFAVELVDGEILYARIADENEATITLANVYYFNAENATQLVNYDARNPAKIFARADILATTLLSESNPVLRAIREFESE